MSQSSKTLREFGSLSLKQDLKLKTGSVSTVSVQMVPTTPTALTNAENGVSILNFL